MTGLGWFGEKEHLLHVLSSVHADRDEEGNFLIFSEPIIQGLTGEMVVHANTEYSVSGKRQNLAQLLALTSYGISITVF